VPLAWTTVHHVYREVLLQSHAEITVSNSVVGAFLPSKSRPRALCEHNSSSATKADSLNIAGCRTSSVIIGRTGTTMRWKNEKSAWNVYDSRSDRKSGVSTGISPDDLVVGPDVGIRADTLIIR
jgi:hypothetical protein